MAVTTTDLSKFLKPVASGKVRELYEVDSSTLLFVATDRISAYDVILKNGISHKGALLTQLSAHWFSVLSAALPTLRHHFITLDLPPFLSSHLREHNLRTLRNRSMQVRSLHVFPIEAIVRGYLTGSAWAEYSRHGTVHGIPLPAGLRESQKLDRPLYTPSTKAEKGGKDQNIHPDEARRLIGRRWADRIKEVALQCYGVAHGYALERGIVLADTKFEFGVDRGLEKGKRSADTDESVGEGDHDDRAAEEEDVYLVDEVLTPDSSRFWPKDKYEVGRAQESFDKQYLRDWLVKEGLKGKEGVEMPEEIVRETAARYEEAYERLVGRKWDQG